MLLCTLLVVLESARIFLVDLQRHAAMVAFRAFLVGIIEQFCFLRGAFTRALRRGAIQLALDAVCGLLLLFGGGHVCCWCCIDWLVRRVDGYKILVE
jgi:hypothetical protein